MNSDKILPSDISREDRLLLCSVRRFFAGDAQECMQDPLPSDLNWAYLFQSAHRQGVLPIFYRSIDAIGPQSLPEDALLQLEEKFRQNSLRNLTLTGELVRILTLFEAHAIPTIPFKGPVLAARLYGDLALRQSVDLDILIPRADLFRALNLIQEQGYTDPYHLSKTQLDAFLKSKHHIDLHNQDKRLSLELHWRISPAPCSMQTDMEWLWQRAEKRDFLGRSVLSLSPEDLLLVLSDHGARHSWRRLAWICDIARLMKEERIDWSVVLQRAQREGSQRSVLLALSLANMLLGSIIPPEAESKIREDLRVRSLACRVINHIFKDKDALEAADPFGFLRNSLILYFHVMKSRRHRVRYLISRTTSPEIPDLNLIPLPDELHSLYSIVRPLRLSGRYCLRIWRWLLR